MTAKELSASDVALRQRVTELSVHIPCRRLRGPISGAAGGPACVRTLQRFGNVARPQGNSDENRRFTTDISENVADPTEAEEQAARNGQSAVFDNATGQPVDVCRHAIME